MFWIDFIGCFGLFGEDGDFEGKFFGEDGFFGEVGEVIFVEVESSG